MDNIATHWQRVQAQRAALPPGEEFFVTTVASDKAPGMRVGVTSEVKREIAAELLALMTHRLATKEEIEEFHSSAKLRSDDLARVEAAKKQQYALPEELKPLLAAALASVFQQPQNGEAPSPPEKTPKNRGGK
jgi:hypothetical protein